MPRSTFYSGTGAVFRKYREKVCPGPDGPAEFAKRLGKPKKDYEAWEAGFRLPTAKALKLLAPAYGVTLKRLQADIDKVRDKELEERLADFSPEGELFSDLLHGEELNTAREKILLYLRDNLKGPGRLAFELLRRSITTLRYQVQECAAKTADEKYAISAEYLNEIEMLDRVLRATCAELGVDLSSAKADTRRRIDKPTLYPKSTSRTACNPVPHSSETES